MVVTISKVTSDIVQTVCPEVDEYYLPHAVNPDIFKKHADNIIEDFKKEHYDDHGLEDKFTFFWNSRNARRKLSGSLIFWFKDFLDRVGHDKARLMMHTDVRDPNGQDLIAIIDHLGLTNGEVVFSQKKIPPEILSLMYNITDCTISISDAEGFGLSNLESLSCEKPIIVNMTGGMQEQVTDGKEWFGIGLEPASKAIIGSLEVPYIYEDRVSGKDVIDAMEKMYNMSQEERDELGRKGRGHVLKNYNFKKYGEQWVELLTKVYEEKGSWNTRKDYKAWELTEV
jgi:glycosyltransferase involved in cell wall biosynthesis